MPVVDPPGVQEVPLTRPRRQAVRTAPLGKRKVTPLGAADRHLVRRFSWGLTPALGDEVRLAGGSRTWFEAQLLPSSVTDVLGTALNSWFPALTMSPLQIFQAQAAGTDLPWEVMRDFSRWTVARRVYSRRQVAEVMVDFWSNLLHVPIYHDEAWYWRWDYDRVIRLNALTSFEKLLKATITHPAMGLYLDNASSTKDAPNENLGRELLELHTVGVDGGYTEADVKASARMLTGYRVDVWWPAFRSFYDPTVHDTRPVKVMGFSHANSNPDGRAATDAYLSYLARHPATARRLARRLCTVFSSEKPSSAHVDAVAKAYLANGTSIKPTLRALVSHPGFQSAPLGKVRTPMEDYIATLRALGIAMNRPSNDESFANAMYWHYSGTDNAPYEWHAPDGYPITGAAWSSAGRVLTSFRLHRDLASRWWPTFDAVFPDPVSMLPVTMPATLQAVVTNIGLNLLGQKPDAGTCAAVSALVGIPLSRTVTRADLLSDYWTFRRLLVALLDSPIHLHR